MSLDFDEVCAGKFKMLMLLVLVSSVSAIISDGPCPKIKVAEHFDLEKVKPGPWYQVARYPNDIEKKGDCVTLHFKVDGGNKLYIDEIVDGKLEEFSAFLGYDKNVKDKGNLMLYSSNFTESDDNKLFPLYILEIDYDTYYFGYSCIYKEADNKKHEYLWLTSLTNKLSPSARAAAEKFIKASDIIDESKLIWDHFDLDHCKLDNQS